MARAFARAFAREGARVHLVGRTPEPLEAVAATIRAAGLPPASRAWTAGAVELELGDPFRTGRNGPGRGGES
ncbi:hypothetical protein STBA_62800 [Streptomyces sp. MP131-18]|nr:hypothetical protein STBA_62800 [Streptomyces sp. MP131-18]